MANDKVNIKSEDVAAALEAQLSKYCQEVNEGLAKVVDECTTKLVKLTKATAPVGKRGSFRKNITADKKELKRAKRAAHAGFHGRVVSATWYVKAPDYRLTHLLVHGHATKDGGRTKGDPFLANAMSVIEPEFQRKCEEVLKAND